jgi:hypothetical protein
MEKSNGDACWDNVKRAVPQSDAVTLLTLKHGCCMQAQHQDAITHRPNAVIAAIRVASGVGEFLDLKHGQGARVVLQECLGGEPVVCKTKDTIQL